VGAPRLADERAELRQLRQEGGSLGSHRPCFTLVALVAHPGEPSTIAVEHAGNLMRRARRESCFAHRYRLHSLPGARPRPRDPPAPCAGRPAPHAWPPTQQPRHPHCMVIRSMRLGARVPGRAPATHPKRRSRSAEHALAPAAPHQPARPPLGAPPLRAAPCASHLTAPHTSVHARTRCLQHRPSWHLSLWLAARRA